ncbi:DNA-directed RNA polymerase III subunit RPC3-like [Phasianus colchicus]|uniref:DNA-directed RNA polymerase III subunit RPC3-like n=1 Tax=Phasianus colchicus TaxID=9054 RepID=UPI00129D5CBB|nr:DNA-directed RNA polymerase III subunit RPC3-like [Phasianus colchicus]
MIPAKEAKDMLYRMLSESFVALQEIPRTPDHAPSRTFYLYAVNVPSSARVLLQRCYKVPRRPPRRPAPVLRGFPACGRPTALHTALCATP